MDDNGINLAHQIAARHGSADECYWIESAFPPLQYPTLSERRGGCLFELAGLVHDPQICKGLMPSSYGLTCVGGATVDLPCTVMGDRTVEWKENGQFRSASLAECAKPQGRSRIGDQCCHIATVDYLKKIDDCSPVSSDPMMLDQCYTALAYKKVDPSICFSIQNANIRSACSIAVGVLSEHPELNRREPPLE